MRRTALALAAAGPLLASAYDCSWLPRDNCQDSNEVACGCRAQHPEGPCTPCSPKSSCKSYCCGDDCPMEQAPAGAPAAAPAAAPVAPAPAPKAPTCKTDHVFPEPTVEVNRRSKTREQAWMDEHWPGYLNGLSLGGAYVIEDWMFYSHPATESRATLQLNSGTQFDQLQWCEALLQGGDLERAYATMSCHVNRFYDDAELDLIADFGINTIRLVVGYWLFDDVELYPGDSWLHEPTGSGEFGDYGVNPDGFITPGARALSDMVIKLHNRNMKVLVDMHALPGCSSPHQSYAGMHCEPQAPNTWNGQAKDGVSGGHKVHRADDGKTWSDVAWKIALERVVPWIKYMNRLVPGTIIGYEVINEPDIAFGDGTLQEIRSLTVDLGKAVKECLSDEPDFWIGIGTASKNSPPAQVAQDYKTMFADEKNAFVSDVHHYFAWSGCIDYGRGEFSVQCACESNLPGTAREFEDTDWGNWMKSGIFNDGWRFYVGEWSAGNTPAHSCQGGLPTRDEAERLWQAQKWGYLSQYLAYRGKAAGGGSSFAGDFYWNGRMGFNWNPDPDVCSGPTSAAHYAGFSNWDWSFMRLIKLDLIKPLSTLGWTPDTLASKKAETCTGTWKVQCAPGSVPAAPPGGQPGMGPAPAPPGGQPGMRLNDAAVPQVLEATAAHGGLHLGLLAGILAGLVAGAAAAVALRRGGAGRPADEREQPSRSDEGEEALLPGA